MGLKLQSENYGKLLLIGASILIWVLILLLFKTTGVNRTWRFWNVPTSNVSFLDFRLIPGSAESFANGYEPSVENPFDPGQRIFNYPAFWRLFFYTGIEEDDTVWISITMIILFFISVFIFPEKLSIAGAVAMLMILFSPASMLLYERANVDLIVFVICILIVLAESHYPYLATLLIMFGSIVKLFPFFGVTVLLKEPRNKFLSLFIACSTVLAIYMVSTLNSVKASWTLTMRGDGASFGTDVFVTRYGPAISRTLSHSLSQVQITLLLKYGSLAIALLLLLAVVIRAFMELQQPGILSQRNFAAFRMGASIYVGTFLLGNNWDYRLAFLVLLIPQLVEWMRSASRGYRIVSLLSLILVLLSCWHFWIVEISLVSVFHSLNDSQKFWIILDEIFNWMLFACLAYLLVASAPGWVKEFPRNIFPKGGVDKPMDQSVR